MIIKYLKILLATSLLHISVYSHCQIPCGIYSDAAQIMQIYEDLETIQKAMQKINELSTTFDAQELNQISRWVHAKEIHSQNIQDITSEYFLTQRIKQNSENYTKKITTLHQLLIAVMKCKQTVDKKNVTNANSILENFINLYFDKHGLEHLKNLRG